MGRPEKNRPLGRKQHRWEDNTKTVLKEIQWESVDLRVKSGGFLWTQYWTFGFYKMQQISQLAEKGLTIQEGTGSMESVTYIVFSKDTTICRQFYLILWHSMILCIPLTSK